ncbi:MAG: alpha-glucan family phosphorylase [Candidatus Dormibacteraeota bacterium]|uniref:Alpha-glucan family phosphorylase n=1 Tax=Candidatus Dormiibacter inghamiae TaxID=3127013 RepID=A0A934N8D7_9BACT|nr:alpha-glucan family phosphorylase [Candidatus Dormibacteraeota bacterium]MBJ7605163.1 alpha-glucan family phosphorylase [Candidatus Dormibacteraeota bacterium]
MLAELRDFALDLFWSWEPRVQALFKALDSQIWEESKHNPVVLLASLGEAGAESALQRPQAQAALSEARAARAAYKSRPPAFNAAEAPLQIAYFSLEFGISEALPIYSGGLGILAGDHLKAASDLGLPLIGVGLLYREGFGHQRIGEDGGQFEEYTASDFPLLPLSRVVDRSGLPLTVTCPLGPATVTVAVWKAQVGRVDLYLLDTDLPENQPEFRSITDRLYVPEAHRRLPQEMVLGIGGVRALGALEIEATVFHMNEGHGFLVATERLNFLRRERGLTAAAAEQAARASLIFTTHTPIAAGSDFFPPHLVQQLLSPYLEETGMDLEHFLDLGRKQPGSTDEPLCTTYVGLRSAGCSVGVSKLHGEVSRRLWKDAWPGLPESEVPIGSVTNGVHLPSWVSPELAALLQLHVAQDWWNLSADDRRWAGVENIDPAALWAAHTQLRHRLVRHARSAGEGGGLDPEALVVGFSRRFATYKRANLLVSDRERLHALVNGSERPVQFIFAGKSHPADLPGKAILREIVQLAREEPRIAFLEDYDIEVARLLVQGSDVWLNNPRRLLEASGTSGMKAGANGVLNLSILDGWWDEGYRPTAGWAIPSSVSFEEPQADDAGEAKALFELLEGEVAGAFYARDSAGLPLRWLAMMRDSISHTAANFSARRMVLDYLADCYAPATERVDRLRRSTVGNPTN